MEERRENAELKRKLLIYEDRYKSVALLLSNLCDHFQLPFPTSDAAPEKRAKTVLPKELSQEDIERLITEESYLPLLKPTPGFILESSSKPELSSSNNNVSRESISNQSWYRDFFVKHDHQNYISIESPLGGPMILSIKREKSSGEGSNIGLPQTPETQDFYRVIVRLRDGEQRIVIPTDSVDLKDEIQSLFTQINPLLTLSDIYSCQDPELTQTLIKYEEKLYPKSFKIGVLYCTEGQTNEEEMFGNSESDVSDDFKEFLDMMGDTIQLTGWAGYTGGLDVKQGQTGEKSLYTVYERNEVMFHVSTMLPHNPIDKQQIEKKRHIGNDIALLVFQDEDCTCAFTTDSVASKFIEVVLVVRVEKQGGVTHYRLACAAKKGIPSFPPKIGNCLVPKDESTRDLILTKLISGELSAYRGPSFFEKHRTARDIMITEYVNKFYAKQHENMTKDRKKQNRRSRNFGQAIKLFKSGKGT